MVIYRITNNINGKKYIGQTTGNVKKRWTTHCARSSRCVAINGALKKYGKDNFIFEVIDIASSIEDLNNKEEYWIEKENSLSPNGYNLTKGGNNRQLSKEAKERARYAVRDKYESIICLDSGKKYHNISEAARYLGLTHSTINYVVHGHGDSAGGMKFQFVNPSLRKEAEKIQLERQEKTRQERAKGQEIICLENGVLYKTIKSAAADLNIRTCDINSFFTGRLITAKGYTFKYIDEEKNMRRQLVREFRKDGKKRGAAKAGEITSRPIICVELNKSYKSISLASRELKINIRSIGNMLSGRSKSAGGYTFKYID
jgi:group I intron endonuclease